jgi:mannosyltransferase
MNHRKPQPQGLPEAEGGRRTPGGLARLIHAGQDRSVALTLGVILATGLLLRFMHLGEPSLQFDEAVRLAIARLDWRAWLNVLVNREANMALYHGLLRGWIQFGDSEFFLRSLSVMAAGAGVLLLYALGARLFARRVGLIAAVLLAFNGFGIRYAQDARAYSILLFLVTLSSLILVKAIERPSRNIWVGYTLTTVLAAYCHLFGMLALPAHWASLLSLPRRAAPWRQFLASTLAVGILVLPLGIFAVTRSVGQIDWLSKPGLRNVARFFSALAGGGGDPLLGAYLICFLLALWAAERKWLRFEGSFESWHFDLLLCWLFVPIALTLAVSLLKPIFLDRYLIICLPPFVLLAALGVSEIPSRWLRGIALIVLVGLSLRGTFFYYHRATRYEHREFENWRGATSYILSHAQTGDALAFYHTRGRIPFDYYRDRLKDESRKAIPEFPTPQLGPPELMLSILGDQSDVTAESLETLSAKYARIWLVLYPGNDIMARSPIRGLLAKKFRTLEEWQLGSVRVILYRGSQRGSVASERER